MTAYLLGLATLPALAVAAWWVLGFAHLFVRTRTWEGCSCTTTVGWADGPSSGEDLYPQGTSSAGRWWRRARHDLTQQHRDYARAERAAGR